ncbi:histone acetyltransferase p300-like [Hyalella azteca]|uniref:Histone acetyltransferase p300-like n=1 Tax=Hyalella azteca TaxID=294128 RepID=A0A979FR22_HYAAZ|nr:histone acetyltransferase p300-like [Hyalella azteca]
MRNYLVQRLVQAIPPDPEPITMQDESQNLVNYARKVEGNLFSMASSQEDYLTRVTMMIQELVEGQIRIDAAARASSPCQQANR